MSTTAAKGGYGAATGYAYQSDYRLTHSGAAYGHRGYKTASPAKRQPKHEEPPLPESCLSRGGYLRATKTLRRRVDHFRLDRWPRRGRGPDGGLAPSRTAEAGSASRANPRRPAPPARWCPSRLSPCTSNT